MDINIYDLKLREIDRQIDDITKQYPITTDFSRKMSSSQYAAFKLKQENQAEKHANNPAYQAQLLREEPSLLTLDSFCTEFFKKDPSTLAVCKAENAKKQVYNLSIKRAAIVWEMEKEQQYLKDQYILQQQQATKFAEQQALKAAEEVRAAANKTEQELQIANQKLAQANEALAKQKAAESLAKSVDTGNLEAGRILMGINTVSKYKTPLIIGAVTLTVLALGFVGYKMLAKAKKV